jgi:superfamily II DNA/RNA helicase
MNLRVTTIYGGVSQTRQVQALRDGVEIVVATPGRVEDLMGQGFLRLDAIEITVLDEADHMADLGFLPVVTKILAATPTGAKTASLCSRDNSRRSPACILNCSSSSISSRESGCSATIPPFTPDKVFKKCTAN